MSEDEKKKPQINFGALDKLVKETGSLGTDAMYPTQLTDAEKADGFEVSAIRNPGGHYALASEKIKVVARHLGDRLAVKTLSPIDKKVHYAILHIETFRPIEEAAVSLVELKQRHPL